MLKENAPKTLEEFIEIKYNDNDKWNKLKYQYRTVNRYEVDGNVAVDEILKLDKIAYYNKQSAFDYSTLQGKARKSVKELKKRGNSASMCFNGRYFYLHSQVGFKNTLVSDAYIGKEELIGLSETRVFTVKDLGDYIPREYDTEAKFLEFVAKRKTPDDVFLITILSEKHICDSCRGVVKQFKDMFPNATVNIISGKKNYNGSTNGLKTWVYRKKV